MKRFIYLLLFACNFCYSQSTCKIDTVFSGKYFFDRTEYSNISKWTNSLKSKCITEEINFDRSTNLENNLQYSIMSRLIGFNKFTKSTIFSDYKYIVYAKFCYNCDVFDDITLIEFHFNDRLKIKKFKLCIDKIIKDKDFFNYPQEKLFYYNITNDNICYLLISTKYNPNNEIFNELKKKIEVLN